MKLIVITRKCPKCGSNAILRARATKTEQYLRDLGERAGLHDGVLECNDCNYVSRSSVFDATNPAHPFSIH